MTRTHAVRHLRRLRGPCVRLCHRRCRPPLRAGMPGFVVCPTEGRFRPALLDGALAEYGRAGDSWVERGVARPESWRIFPSTRCRLNRMLLIPAAFLNPERRRRERL